VQGAGKIELRNEKLSKTGGEITGLNVNVPSVNLVRSGSEAGET